MGRQIPGLEKAYEIVFIIAIVVLAVLIILCLIRAIIGPKLVDRIISINMMGTMVMVIIAVMALKMNESYLVDISLIYAMISFLAVIVISKVYMGVYIERQKEEDTDDGSL